MSKTHNHSALRNMTLALFALGMLALTSANAKMIFAQRSGGGASVFSALPLRSTGAALSQGGLHAAPGLVYGSVISSADIQMVAGILLLIGGFACHAIFFFRSEKQLRFPFYTARYGGKMRITPSYQKWLDRDYYLHHQ